MLSAGSPRVSVCVCTFRRPHGLRRTLASLALDGTPPGVVREIVVVDNDPAGSARAVVDAAGPAGTFAPLRYVIEPTPGVSHARNRCMREASGSLIAFIDDDEHAKPGWLAEHLSVFEASAADAVFGPVIPEFEGEAPAWVVASGVFERPRHPTGSPIDWREARTGNVLFRRELADRFGSFDPAFAVTGGEDSLFFARAWKGGARLVWSDRAVVHESVTPARVSRAWMARRAFYGGRTYVRVLASLNGPSQYVLEAAKGTAAIAYYALLLSAGWARPPFSSVVYLRKIFIGLGKVMAGFARGGEYGR